MSDARALLKAKRQEIRITHPLANYSTSGQLRCVACSTIVKHTSAWEGHLGSKAHRTNVARLKEEERLKDVQREEHFERKRKAKEAQLETDQRKRRFHGEMRDPTVDSFPSDFFSDPSQAPVSNNSSDDEAERKPEKSSIDLEWEIFENAMIRVPNHRETYERATVIAEPVLTSEASDGFPFQKNIDTGVVSNSVDEEEARRRKEHDERELIMDRLLDEEVAQEEADAKVAVLKGRLQALKKERKAAKPTRRE